jgi:hypothetical protein
MSVDGVIVAWPYASGLMKLWDLAPLGNLDLSRISVDRVVAD